MAPGASGNGEFQSGNVCFELRLRTAVVAVVAVVTECRDGQSPRAAVPIQVPGVGVHIASWELGRLSRTRRGSQVGSWVVSLPLPAASRTWAAVNPGHGLDMAWTKNPGANHAAMPNLPVPAALDKPAMSAPLVADLENATGKSKAGKCLEFRCGRRASPSPSIVVRQCLTLTSTETPEMALYQDKIKDARKGRNTRASILYLAILYLAIL